MLRHNPTSYPHGDIYGPLTTAAVKNFQQANGLPVDGWAGDKTQAKLQQAVAVQ